MGLRKADHQLKNDGVYRGSPQILLKDVAGLGIAVLFGKLVPPVTDAIVAGHKQQDLSVLVSCPVFKLFHKSGCSRAATAAAPRPRPGPPRPPPAAAGRASGSQGGGGSSSGPAAPMQVEKSTAAFEAAWTPEGSARLARVQEFAAFMENIEKN